MRAARRLERHQNLTFLRQYHGTLGSEMSVEGRGQRYVVSEGLNPYFSGCGNHGNKKKQIVNVLITSAVRVNCPVFVVDIALIVIVSFANLSRRVETLKVRACPESNARADTSCKSSSMFILSAVSWKWSGVQISPAQEMSLSTLADAASLKAPHDPYLEDCPCIENNLPPLS